MADAMIRYGTRSINNVKKGKFSLANVKIPEPKPLPMPTIPPMSTNQRGGVRRRRTHHKRTHKRRASRRNRRTARR